MNASVRNPRKQHSEWGGNWSLQTGQNVLIMRKLVLRRQNHSYHAQLNETYGNITPLWKGSGMALHHRTEANVVNSQDKRVGNLGRHCIHVSDKQVGVNEQELMATHGRYP